MRKRSLNSKAEGHRFAICEEEIDYATVNIITVVMATITIATTIITTTILATPLQLERL